MRLLIPPPLLAVIFAVAIWYVGYGFPQFALSIDGLRMLASVFFAIGVMIEVISFSAFRRAKTTVSPIAPSKTSTLIVSGLNRISRNPMYLGLLIVLCGWALWLGNPLNIAPLLLFVWYITEFQIKPEEKILKQKFGAQYEAYCKKVRRWI